MRRIEVLNMFKCAVITKAKKYIFPFIASFVLYVLVSFVGEFIIGHILKNYVSVLFLVNIVLNTIIVVIAVTYKNNMFKDMLKKLIVTFSGIIIFFVVDVGLGITRMIYTMLGYIPEEFYGIMFLIYLTNIFLASVIVTVVIAVIKHKENNDW